MSGDVVVLGSTGFIGGAVQARLRQEGLQTRSVSAPRLVSRAVDLTGLTADLRRFTGEMSALARSLEGADVVVNAAGSASPGSRATASLLGANALLPLLVATAARSADVQRLVHVSSAAVQGHRATLDESFDYAPFSPYSSSKALGEQALLGACGAVEAVCYRPTSVHGPERATTRNLVRLARSPASAVAAPGTAPTPQVLVCNVAAGIAHVVRHQASVSPVVLQPNEGLTVASVLTLLGGRSPRLIPPSLCRPLTAAGASSIAPVAVRQHVRRLEMLWFGQDQHDAWLRQSGFAPVAFADEWTGIARQVSNRHENSQRMGRDR